MASGGYTRLDHGLGKSRDDSWDRVGVLVWALQSVRHQHTRGAPGAKWVSVDMRLNFPVQLSKVLHVKFAGGGLDGPAGSPWRTGHVAGPSPLSNADLRA